MKRCVCHFVPKNSEGQFQIQMCQTVTEELLRQLVIFLYYIRSKCSKRTGRKTLVTSKFNALTWLLEWQSDDMEAKNTQ